MKKNILIILVLFIGLTISPPLTYGQSTQIQGWWKAQLVIEEMDFTTTEWAKIQAVGDKASYLYIGPNDKAYLVEQDNTTKEYYLEDIYTVFSLSDALVLKGPYKTNTDGTLSKNSTFIMRKYELANNTTWLKGHYTRYDCL